MQEQNREQENEIDLLEAWNVLWRRKSMLIAFSVVAVTATMLTSMQSPKFYKSETTIMTSGSESGGLGAALSALPFAGALGGVAGQSSADKIMVILKSRTIAETVIRKFDLVKVFNEKKWDAAKGAWKDPSNPPLMEDAVKMLITEVAKFNKSKEGAVTITVEWKNAGLAADIANSYVSALTGFMNEKSVNMTIQIVDRAVPAERKSRPKVLQNMILAGVVSMFLGAFIAFLLEYLPRLKKN